MADIIVLGLAIAAIAAAVRYFPVVCAKEDPELDAEVRRIEYIEKKICETGYNPSSRHSEWLWRKYGEEYDEMMAASQRPPSP